MVNQHFLLESSRATLGCFLTKYDFSSSQSINFKTRKHLLCLLFIVFPYELWVRCSKADRKSMSWKQYYTQYLNTLHTNCLNDAGNLEYYTFSLHKVNVSLLLVHCQKLHVAASAKLHSIPQKCFRWSCHEYKIQQKIKLLLGDHYYIPLLFCFAFLKQ